MTPEELDAYRKVGREAQREKRKDPDVMQRCREDSRNRYRKRKEEEPGAYNELREYQRNYYRELKKTPEGRAKLAEYYKRGKANKKHRMKTDIWYREKVRAEERIYKKKYRIKKKLESAHAKHPTN